MTGCGVLFRNKYVAQPLWHEADGIRMSSGTFPPSSSTNSARDRLAGRRPAGGVNQMMSNRLIAESLTDEELQCVRAKLRNHAEVGHKRRQAA